MLEVKQAGYAVGDTWLLRNVSLKVKPGSFHAVAGANGAGKTTLLRLMCGEIGASEGAIEWDGKPVAAYSAAEMARRRACLGQHREGQFPFTVYEVALMGRMPHLRGAYETPEDHAIVSRAMDETGMAPLTDREYPTLSGGEATRTHVARTIAQQTDVVLLDEPTNHLDLRRQVETLNLFRKKTQTDNVAVVAVLHDLNLAALFADDLLILKGGRTVAQGRPKDVLTPDLVHHAFGMHCVIWDHPSGCPWVVPIPDHSHSTEKTAPRIPSRALLEETFR